MNDVSGNELWKSFINPPDTYGEIPCYWWEAGDLHEEEIRAHVRDMHAKGICGTVMFNLYFSGDDLSSRPAYFTDGWWDMVRVLADEEKKLGMEFWFSDWTGRKYWQELISEEIVDNPGLRGYRLLLHEACSTKDELTEDRRRAHRRWYNIRYWIILRRVFTIGRILGKRNFR